MANMSFLNFNAQNVAPQQAVDVLPAGDYNAAITESSIKPTKSGTGTILNLTWTVLDGPFHGRKVFSGINIQNQSPEAEKIGQSELSAICHATGVMNLQDSVQLHNRPVKIKVKIRKDEQWGDKNEVKGYSAVQQQPGSAPSFVPPAQNQAPAQHQAPAAATPPWIKSAA